MSGVDHAKGIYVPIDDSTALNGAVISLVVGKFRSLLAILFGVGLWLQFKRREAKPKNWPGGYLKRTFWLAFIGLLHAILIWDGDILLYYAVVAFVAMFLVNLPRNILLAIIGSLAALTVLCGFGLLAFHDFLLQGAVDRYASDPLVYGEGNYLVQLRHRLSIVPEHLMDTLISVPAFLPLFLTGILLGRSRVLERPSSRPRIRNAALALGIGIGLPLNLIGLTLGSNTEFSILWEVVLGPILGLGYVMLGAVIVEAGLFRTGQKALAKVGRVALSAYLLQSILCTAIFYSWGGDLYGKLNAMQLLGVTAAVWVVCVVFAYAWLALFDIGPVEWLWRSLTEGKLLPLRRKALQELDKPVVEQRPTSDSSVAFQL
jgi:uncharacterized protein